MKRQQGKERIYTYKESKQIVIVRIHTHLMYIIVIPSIVKFIIVQYFMKSKSPDYDISIYSSNHNKSFIIYFYIVACEYGSGRPCVEFRCPSCTLTYSIANNKNCTCLLEIRCCAA